MNNSPFATEYCNESELRTLGFKAAENNIKIAKNFTIIGLSNISIGDIVKPGITGYAQVNEKML